MPVSEVKKYHV